MRSPAADRSRPTLWDGLLALLVAAAAVAAARRTAVAATTMMLRETEPMAQGIFRR